MIGFLIDVQIVRKESVIFVHNIESVLSQGKIAKRT